MKYKGETINYPMLTPTSTTFINKERQLAINPQTNRVIHITYSLPLAQELQVKIAQTLTLLCCWEFKGGDMVTSTLRCWRSGQD